MRASKQKQKQPQKALSSGLARPTMPQRWLDHHAHPLLDLQHMIGNKAVTRMLQREVGSTRLAVPQGSPETVSGRIRYSGHEGDSLRNQLWDLADNKVTTYVTYRNAIAKSTAIEKRSALNTVLLSKLRDTLDHVSFARCVESLGRRAPTFDELRKWTWPHDWCHILTK